MNAPHVSWGSKALLTLNAGSSSIKFALYRAQGLQRYVSGMIEGLGGARVAFRARHADGRKASQELGSAGISHSSALRWLLGWLDESADGLPVAAVGHRVVHGGMRHSAPVRIDDAVLAHLSTLEPLAPLHQPHNLSGVRAAREAFAGVPQVACFDTAFHRNQPFMRDSYALPRDLYDAGVRRYGFHGLSYEYIAQHLAQHYAQLASSRVIVAHLGNGASMCAMQNGRSIASSMGFSALDGLIMGTRCGQIDPGVLLYLMQNNGMDADSISELLYAHSGLKALSGGLSNDMRDLLASDTAPAREAVECFVYSVCRQLGSLAAALGGIDALVFTGGIGENAAVVRAQIMQQLQWLGLEMDASANEAGQDLLSQAGSRVLALRIPTDEEAMIASHTLRLAKTP